MTGGIDVPRLEAAHRRLVLWFGVQVVGEFGALALVVLDDDTVLLGLLRLGSSALLLVTLVALSSYAFRTAAALGSDVAWLWGVAMLAPCLNAITLVALSIRAAWLCREHNIPVGVFGPGL